MEIEIRNIDEKTFKDLPPECSGCLYWEAPEKFGKDEQGAPKVPKDKAIKIKQGWFSTTRKTMSSCGKIIYIDGNPAGYAQYAPPHFLEYTTEYSRKLFPPSPDGILLSCLYIQTGYQGKGLGTILLQAIIEDVRQSSYQALETYSRDDSANNCSGPSALYLVNGFRVLNSKKWENATFSLMRFELA